MSFDRAALQAAVAREGRVARVVVAEITGSVPREVGAAMLVWETGQAGTIGGGALEYQAVTLARGRLSETGPWLDRRPLGPSLGQCCGGAVTLVTEIWDSAALAEIEGEIVARPVQRGAEEPLEMRRLLAAARSQGTPPAPHLIAGWMIEPVTRATQSLWIYGAGHVGRALVAVMAPLPDVAITWVDTGPERYPETVPEGVTVLPAANPADAVRLAPADAGHLVLTYSHALDLEICHRLLSNPFGWAGLIGSATKWARFRSRLAALGHGEAQIARIACPIGDRRLGKHPQAIAVGVAAAYLNRTCAERQRLDGTG